MQFQLPRYAPPASFADTYLHGPRPAGANSMFNTASNDLSSLLAQQSQGQPNPQQLQNDQNMYALQQKNANAFNQQNNAGTMSAMPATPLGTAMTQYPSPGLSQYINKGLSPSTNIPGNTQPIRTPSFPTANPRPNLIAGYRP